MAKQALDLANLPFGLAPSTPEDFEILSGVSQFVTPPQPAAPPQRNWVSAAGASNYRVSGDTDFADYPKAFGKGMVDIVGALLSLPEMANLVDPGTLTGGTERAAQAIVQSMSPSARKNLERKWTDIGPDGVLRNPMAAIGQLAAVAPSVLASLVPAAGAATWATRAGKSAQAARNIGTAVGVGSEALQIGGATYQEIKQHMDAMTHDELLGSPEYQKAFKKWGDEAEARKEVLLKASRGPAAANAVWGAMVAALPARLAARYGTGERFGGTARSRFAKGFGIEGTEELAQEVPGGIATGMAIQGAIDPSFDPTADLAERAVASFALGGGIGGPLGVLAGGQAPSTSPSRDVPPEVQAAAQMALPLEDVPGEGQPGPLRPPPSVSPYGPGGQGVLPGMELGGPEGQQEQLDLFAGAPRGYPPIGPQGEYQTEMDFRPEGLPILPQDTSQPIAMPPTGPGQVGGFQPDLFQQEVGPPPPSPDMIAPLPVIMDEIEQMLDPESGRTAVYVDAIPPGVQQEYLTAIGSRVGPLMDDSVFGAVHQPSGSFVLTTDRALMEEFVAEGPTDEILARQQVTPEPQVTRGPYKRPLTTDDQINMPFAPDSEVGTEIERVGPEPISRRQALIERRAKRKAEREAAEAAAVQETDREVDLFNRFKKAFETSVFEGQQDMFGGAEGALANVTPEQLQEIEGYIDQATAAVNQPGPGDKGAALDAINQILGGTKGKFKTGEPSYDALERVVAEAEGRLVEETPQRREGEQAAPDVDEEVTKAERARRAAGARVASKLARREARKARKQKKSALPLDAESERLLSEAQQLEGKEQKQLTLPVTRKQPKKKASVMDKTLGQIAEEAAAKRRKAKAKRDLKKPPETKKQREAKWQKRKASGKVKPHPEQQFLKFRAEMHRAVQNILVSLGLTPEQARAYKLDDKHLNFGFTLGPADAKTDDEGRVRRGQFVKELGQLEVKMKLGGPNATLELIEDQGLRGIAAVLVGADMKLPKAKAISKVKQYVKNPNKVVMPDTLKAKLRKLFDRKVEEALGMTQEQAELEALIAQQEQDTDVVESEFITGADEKLVGTADIEGKPEDSVGFADDLGAQPEGGRSGKSSTKGSKGPTKSTEKSQQDKERAALARSIGRDQPAPESGVDGTTAPDATRSTRGRAERVIVPEGKLPEPISPEIFASQYQGLDEDQREGVNLLTQRMLNNPRGSASVLGDGTGLGKTSELLVAAHQFQLRERAKGNDPKILLVAPKEAILKQAQQDSARLGIFNTTPGGYRKKPKFDGMDTALYGDLKKLAETGATYDLVIFDEAHNLANPKNTYFKNANAIGKTHAIYVTATPGDKEENLALLAAVEGKTLPEFLRELDPTIEVVDGTIDVASIRNRSQFLDGLVKYIDKLRNNFGYFRREYPRLSEQVVDEVTKTTKMKLPTSEGQMLSLAEIEKRYINYLNQNAKNAGEAISKARDASAKLSELAKIDHIVRRVKQAEAEHRKSIVLFYAHESGRGKNPPIPLGGGVTVKIPLAIDEVQMQLNKEYGVENVGRVTGGAGIGAKQDKFQNGSMKVLLSTYQSLGVGLNLDANVPAEEGGWGREMIMVTDDWSPDMIDQAHGRVDRRSTQIPPVVRRLYIDGFLSDRIREERVKYKEQVQKILRGVEPEPVYGLDKSLAVRTTPDEDVVAVRIKYMPPGDNFNQVLAALKRLGDSYNRASQEHFIPVQKWEAEKPKLRTLLESYNKGEAVAPTPEPVATPKKPTPKQAVKQESPDLRRMTQPELEVMEADLMAKLDKAKGDEYLKLSAELDHVYKAMEQNAPDFNMLGAGKGRELPAGVLKSLSRGQDSAQLIFRKLARTTKGMTPPQRQFIRKMAAKMNNTRVVVLDEETHRQLTEDAASRAAYSRRDDTIYLRDGTLTEEALLHEGLHAVMHFVVSYDVGVRRTVMDMQEQVMAKFDDWSQNRLLGDNEIMRLREALTDPQEFVTYAMTDPTVGEIVASVEGSRNFWQRMIDAVLNFLGMKGPQRRSVLDDLVKLVEENMTESRAANVGVLNMLGGVMGNTDGVETLGKMLDQVQPNGPRSWGEIRSAIRRRGLGVTTLRQMEKIYRHVLEKLPVENPLRRWFDAMQERQKTQDEYATIGNAMHRDYMEAMAADDGAHATNITKLISDTSFYGIWPNKDFDHEDNAHLKPSHRKHWEEMRDIYQNDKVARDIWDKLLKFYADEKRENFVLRIENILRGVLMSGSQIQYEAKEGVATKITDTRGMLKTIGQSLFENEGNYDPMKFVALDENGEVDETVGLLLKEAMRKEQAGTLQTGPYFPQMRVGEWIVSVHRDEQDFSASLSAAEISAIKETAKNKIGKPADEWTAEDTEKYTAQVEKAKRKALTEKLDSQRDDYMAERESVEWDTPVYTDDTVSTTGRVRLFALEESEAKAKKLLAELKEEGWNNTNAEGNEQWVTRKVSTATNAKAVNSALINHVRAKLGAKGGPVMAALEASMIDMMPETAMQKRFLKRKNIQGFMDDHGRALAIHVRSASWYRATLEHGQEINQTVSDITKMEKELADVGETYRDNDQVTMVGDLLREVRKHVDLETDHNEMTPLMQKAGQVGFLWMLASPAYVLVNSTQPLMFGLPWLKARQQGGMPAWRAFKDAYNMITPEIKKRAGLAVKQAATGYDVDPELFDFLQRGEGGATVLNDYVRKRIQDRVDAGTMTQDMADGIMDMMEDLSKRNVLDFTLALDTTAAAEGKSDTNLWTRTMDVARILPHLTEVLNRSVMSIAAYQMAVSQGMNHEAATDFAVEAVVETQFDYTLLNKPRFMSERYFQLAKPIFMFMQHPQHVYALFVHTALTGGRYAKLKRSGAFDSNNPEHQALEREWKERRDTIVGVLSTHMLMGGVTAAMFEPAKWALGLALMVSEAISGEPPEETEVYVRRWVNNTFGNEVLADVMTDGLPTLMGLNLSNNLAISNLALMNSPSKYSIDREGVEGLAMSIGGPLAALMANAAQGISDIHEGDVVGGLARSMPRAIREPMRAFAMANKGLRDSNGHAIVGADDLSPLDLAYSTLGLRPHRTQKAYAKKAAVDSVKNWHRLRRKRLSERLYRARGDAEATRKVIDDIQKYNESLPPGARPVPTVITPQKMAAERALQEHGAVVSSSEEWIAENY